MRAFLIVLFLVISQLSIAGGIRGVIKGEDGTLLGYATIYVRQTATGVASDTDGRYEVALPPGTYDIIYQYLGYESVTRQVVVGDGFEVINITLKTHTVVLQNITIRAGDEDPAYTIMRKAIAKAKYHTQQIDSYTARVYIKGRGKLVDYPWLAKKALEKEGITKDRLFIQESVSDIKYTRPNKFEEKVIAIYTTGKSEGYESPNAYVFGSFYEPEIAETISPLAPKSFSYYRFEYLGTFKDRGFDISKIKVTPRSKGDNVVEGTLYIVEDWWSIHSVDFRTTKLGVGIHVKQIYNPIEEKAWLPVSQTFKVSGKVFGFEFEGDYLATVRDYKIVLNPALPQEMKVVDEKVEKEQAETIKKAHPRKKNQQLEQRLAEGKEVTDKELRQLVKEYEKQEIKEQKEPDVISDTNFSVDSMATKKDSTFWQEMRPVALSKEEVRGYQKQDSLNEIERKKNEGDTLRKANSKNRQGFQPWDVLTGDSYKITETSNFRIHTPYGGFNTVEGVFGLYRLSLYKRWVVKDSTGKKDLKTYRLEINPGLRYSFARNKVTGFLRTDFRAGRNARVTATGGRYIEQFNSEEPIHNIINTFSTLVWGQNYMKIYERDFVDLNYRQRFNDKYTFRGSLGWANRSELFNNTSYTFFDVNEDKYTPNAPVNVELPATTFDTHAAFVGSFGLEARPWQKFRIRNGNKQRVDHSSPLFTIDYRKGFNNVFGSEVDFDMLEIGARDRIKVGVRGTLDVAARAGMFFNTRSMYFMDYRHFMGNQTIFMISDPVASYRLLDYYQYSTSKQYLQVHANYQFRKFLITQLPKARLLGLGERIFVSNLSTPDVQFTEVGYSLDGILRVFRVEFASSFTDFDFANPNFGFRIGVASSIAIEFND
jgi:hypothetical protein